MFTLDTQSWPTHNIAKIIFFVLKIDFGHSKLNSISLFLLLFLEKNRCVMLWFAEYIENTSKYWVGKKKKSITNRLLWCNWKDNHKVHYFQALIYLGNWRIHGGYLLLYIHLKIWIYSVYTSIWKKKQSEGSRPKYLKWIKMNRNLDIFHFLTHL